MGRFFKNIPSTSYAFMARGEGVSRQAVYAKRKKNGIERIRSISSKEKSFMTPSETNVYNKMISCGLLPIPMPYTYPYDFEVGKVKIEVKHRSKETSYTGCITTEPVDFFVFSHGISEKKLRFFIVPSKVVKRNISLNKLKPFEDMWNLIGRKNSLNFFGLVR